MASLASPTEVTEFIERELGIKNIFMVVGQPGSGKSTFMKILMDIGGNNFCVDTDAYSKPLRPVIEEKFGKTDVIDIAIIRPREMITVIARKWLEMAAAPLVQAPAESNVFVEIPYGLRPEFQMYRYFGAKIIYVGCEDETVSKKRIAARGNPQTMRFIKTIPDKLLTLEIAAKNSLKVTCIDTSKTIGDLRLEAA